MAHAKSVSIELANFAKAINTVAPRTIAFTSNGLGYASALSLKEKHFPRSDFRNWTRNLEKVIKAGLVRAHSDRDSLYVVVA